MAKVRVRYAPSPTGHLHIAGARTAFFNYLTARHHKGQFIIRIEDTDQSRHVETGIDSQLDGLRWLGIEWDESVDVGGPYGPYRQLERLPLYKSFTDQLLVSGHVYGCYCTEEELEREREEQEARGEMLKYSGRCRHLSEEQIRQNEEAGRKPSIRFRVPEGRTISFIDRVREHVEFETDGIGDFIVVRPDGIPTYNYAVVIDDQQMDITLVIRGEEHLSNTPRQLLLYEAFGWEPPEFAHLSLILNQDRKKMSKRDESIIQFVEQYRELGYLPEAIVNFISLLGWSPVGEEELFSEEELTEQFSLDRVAKSPAVFDTDKLNWMSNHYIKKAEPERIIALAMPHLQRAGVLSADPDDAERAWAGRLVKLYQEQLRYAGEIVELAAMFFNDELDVEDEAAAVLAESHVPAVLAAFYAQVRGTADDFEPAAIQSMLKAVQAETGFKGKQLFMSVRAALTGQTHGRDLNETLALLGKDKVLRRLEKRLGK